MKSKSMAEYTVIRLIRFVFFIIFPFGEIEDVPTPGAQA